MEMHSRQSLEAIHQISAGNATAGIAPWQDLAEGLRRLAAAGRWIVARLRRRAA